MRHRDQHQPVAAGLGRRAAAALEVPRGGGRLAGPQLGDPEVHERQRAQVGVDHARLEPAVARQRLTRLERAGEVSAQARHVQ